MKKFACAPGGRTFLFFIDGLGHKVYFRVQKYKTSRPRIQVLTQVTQVTCFLGTIKKWTPQGYLIFYIVPRKGLEPSCLSALAPKASASTNFATWALFCIKHYTLNRDIVRTIMDEKNTPKIIFEDDNIIVLNKPSSLVVHPYDFSNEQTMVDFLRKHFPPMFGIDNKIELQDKRVITLGGIVHKLDRGTSGIMVVAKNQLVFDELKEQFTNHEIKKEYVAVVEGIVEKEKFTIDAPLGRDKKDYRQSTDPKNPRGPLRDAITDVEVIKKRKDTTLIKLFPRTGRTHQLRAHMASIEHPIVGDKVYGSKIESPRIMLHAEKISFTLRGKEYSFSAEIPKEFLSS
jgi:23S rRNA pseudouridine1911/1915/1917 synthase